MKLVNLLCTPAGMCPSWGIFLPRYIYLAPPDFLLSDSTSSGNIFARPSYKNVAADSHRSGESELTEIKIFFSPAYMRERDARGISRKVRSLS